MRQLNLGAKVVLACAAVIVGAAAIPGIAPAQEFADMTPSKRKPLVLKGQGSFFVDGSPIFIDSPYTGTPGNWMINQMYVQFQKPAKRNKQWPIVFVHGCCLSSKTWETTPDGREGWFEYFTRKGFDTYMGDQVGRARSGFNPVKFQMVLKGAADPSTQPGIGIATDAFGWNVFRFGNFSTFTPWPDEKFPMRTVGYGFGSTLTFYKQVIPDMNATLPDVPAGCQGGACTPPDPNTYYPSPAAMADLANGLGGAILVGHSQSSSYPTMAALRPGQTGVKGIIQLETGCFGNLTADDINILKTIPILIVVGDHFPTAQPAEPCPTEMNQINGAGGDMTFISLPDAGMHGNSHMFMQDSNNLQIADLIISWIKQHVKNQAHS